MYISFPIIHVHAILHNSTHLYIVSQVFFYLSKMKILMFSCCHLQAVWTFFSFQIPFYVFKTWNRFEKNLVSRVEGKVYSTPNSSKHPSFCQQVYFKVSFSWHSRHINCLDLLKIFIQIPVPKKFLQTWRAWVSLIQDHQQ